MVQPEMARVVQVDKEGTVARFLWLLQFSVVAETGMHGVQVDKEDMEGTVASFLRLPHHQVKHPEFGTIMRILDREEPFTIALAVDSAAS